MIFMNYVDRLVILYGSKLIFGPFLASLKTLENALKQNVTESIREPVKKSVENSTLGSGLKRLKMHFKHNLLFFFWKKVETDSVQTPPLARVS